MTDVPERIWIEDEFGEGDDDQWTYGTWDVRNYRGYVVEYVRADLMTELVDATSRFEKLMRTQLRTADFHGSHCKCIRCAEDDLFTALAKIKEKLQNE